MTKAKIEFHDDEARVLITQLVKLRNKTRKNKSKNLIAEFNKCQELCIKKFQYLVSMKTKRYKEFANYNDLQQDGLLALTLALRTYEPAKGSFYWWAHKYIDTKISREANKHSTIKIPMHKAKETRPMKVSQFPMLIDDAQSSIEAIEHEDNKTKIVEALQKLPLQHRKIITMTYGFDGIKPYSLSKLSKHLKLPQTTCLKILHEAQEDLKKELYSLI